MPANAAVTLDLKANTASASQGLDTLKKQLTELQKQGGTFLSGFKAQTAMRAVSAAVGQADTFLSAVAPDVAGSKWAKAASSAAASGAQLAAAFAPLAPPFGAVVGASIGTVAGALKSLKDSSREAAKAVAAAAAAEKDRGRKHNDVVGEERWQWENADAAGRGKMQADARERIRKAKWKLDNGMSISDSDVYGVANWDRALALRLGAEAKRQNGGQMPKGLRVLMGQLQSEAYSEIADRNKWEGAKYLQAVRMQEAAEKEGRAGRRGEARTFDERYDAAYAASLEKPGKDGAASSGAAAPNLAALLGGGPSADSLSSIGLGFTGTRRDSQETLELLRRIADSSDRTARKDGGLK